MKSVIKLGMLALLLIFSPAVIGDEIFLKNGARVEGKIIEEGKDLIVVVTPYGFQRVARGRVERIKRVKIIPPADPRKRRARELYDKGVAGFANGRWAAAASNFERAVKLEPNLINAHLYLGDIYRYHYKNLPKAAGEYRKVLAIDPQNHIAHFGMGYIYHDMAVYQKKREMIDRAINEYLKVLELEPLFSMADLKLTVAYLSKGRWDESQYHLGEACRKDGDYDGAIEAYNRTIEVNPGHADAYVGLAIAYYEKGSRKEAASLLEKALALGVKSPAIYMVLGGAYLHQEPPQLDKAISAYNEALKYHQETPLSLKQLWLAYEGIGLGQLISGEVKKSITTFSESLEVARKIGPLPTSSSYYNLACGYALVRDREKCYNFLVMAFKFEKQAGTNRFATKAPSDSDLAGVTSDEKFKELIEQYAGLSDSELAKLKEAYQEDRDYLYWSPDSQTFLVDEEAKAAGVPREEYRTTHPWPQSKSE